MNAPSTSRRYSNKQKAEAIDFCLKENLSCAKAAQRLGLHPNILSSWLRQYRIDQGEALPVDRGLLNTSEQDELIKLRKEIRELRREIFPSWRQRITAYRPTRQGPVDAKVSCRRKVSVNSAIARSLSSALASKKTAGIP